VVSAQPPSRPIYSYAIAVALAKTGSLRQPAAASASRASPHRLPLESCNAVSTAPSAEAPESSLGRLALRGSVVEVLSFGANQAIRLASNLILSRLLFPEAFGLSALVSIFIQALIMLSDVGIEPGVVQSPRGDEERFLNTAWTLQVIRGVVLWLCACLLAWPFSIIYEEPQLVSLIPVASLTVLAGGFSSSSLYTLRRHLRLGTMMVVDLFSQVVGVAAMVAWAYARPTVWALVAGAVVTSVAKSAASYAVPTHVKNRFTWDDEAYRAILHFGKWIFGSSALYFLSKQSDRLLLGRYLGMSALGIYSIAMFLSEALGTVVYRITHGVLYPLFSQVWRDEPTRLKEVYYRARLPMDAAAMLGLGGLMVLGERVVDLLYDDRYADAGWMLEVMCVRVALTCVLTPCETALFSMGYTRYGFFQNIARAAWILAAVPIGYHVAGVHGVVWATALAEVAVAFVVWPPFVRLGMMKWSREALALALFAVGMLLGHGVDHLLTQLFPQL
jgi:O-antigen/teichoic acid export membrane protein